MKDNLIFERTMQEGGITLLGGREFTPKTGFIVGGVTPTIIVDADKDAMVRAICTHMVNDHPMVGTWLNDGKIHVDAVEWIEDRERALEVAKERGEIAIWDCAETKEVFV